jgi:hypothetical protein
VISESRDSRSRVSFNSVPPPVEYIEQKGNLRNIASAGGALLDGVSGIASAVLSDPALGEAMRRAAEFTGTLLASAAITASRELADDTSD